MLLQFAKLKALTQDENILRQALVDSHLTIVDNKIKANFKATGRSTIILREIPSDAPVDEVKEIFNYPGSKPTISIRSEIGDSWFVCMDTEEDAKDTLLDLRLKKRTFRGAAVKARLKTETVVRSFFPVQTGVSPVAPMFPVMPFPGMMGAGMQMPVDMRASGYVGMNIAHPAGDNSSATPAPAAGENAKSGAAKGAATTSAAGATAPSGGKGNKVCKNILQCCSLLCM